MEQVESLALCAFGNPVILLDFLVPHLPNVETVYALSRVSRQFHDMMYTLPDLEIMRNTEKTAKHDAQRMAGFPVTKDIGLGIGIKYATIRGSIRCFNYFLEKTIDTTNMSLLFLLGTGLFSNIVYNDQIRLMRHFIILRHTLARKEMTPEDFVVWSQHRFDDYIVEIAKYGKSREIVGCLLEFTVVETSEEDRLTFLSYNLDAAIFHGNRLVVTYLWELLASTRKWNVNTHKGVCRMELDLDLALLSTNFTFIEWMFDQVPQEIRDTQYKKSLEKAISYEGFDFVGMDPKLPKTCRLTNAIKWLGSKCPAFDWHSEFVRRCILRREEALQDMLRIARGLGDHWHNRIQGEQKVIQFLKIKYAENR